MVQTIVVLLILGLIIAGIFISPAFLTWQRNRLKARVFPALWSAVVENHLPIYSRLSPAERRRLQGHMQVFLAEKQFIGCGGLQITEEMRLTIAAVACLLLLNERGQYFPKLRSILVYPSAYFVKETTALDPYIVEEKQVVRLGESWTRDQLVLSWEQVQYDMAHWQDGHNVILHEFAHQLDQEDGRAEGVPILPQSEYGLWSQVMADAYQRLCTDVQQNRKNVIDPYGATNPAEFFAVATETFFEKSLLLQQEYPALYQLLQHYYQVVPLQWMPR